MIERIITLTNRDKMEMTVFYKAKGATRQKKHYTENDNLPMTVVLFLINAKCAVEYREDGKFEEYTM